MAHCLLLNIACTGNHSLVAFGVAAVGIAAVAVVVVVVVAVVQRDCSSHSN